MVSFHLIDCRAIWVQQLVMIDNSYFLFKSTDSMNFCKRKTTMLEQQNRDRMQSDFNWDFNIKMLSRASSECQVCMCPLLECTSLFINVYKVNRPWMRGRIEQQGYNILKSNTANSNISKLSMTIDFSGYKSISVTYDTPLLQNGQ